MQIQCFRWYVLLPEFTIHCNSSTKQITNLIQSGMATAVTPTYNTTNITNKLASHQFICNVPRNKTTETSYCRQVLLCTQLLLLLHPNNVNIKFSPNTIPFHMHIHSRFHYWIPLWNAHHSSISPKTNSLNMISSQFDAAKLDFANFILQFNEFQ